MKSQLLLFAPCVLMALALFSTASAQSVTTETTTSTVGTVTTVDPNALVVQTETTSEPLRYTFTKTTQYVDETGAPVSFEMVKSGIPVTVHYLKDRDRMVANKVVIRRGDSTITKSTSVAGTVSEFSPEVLVVRTAQDSTPRRYSYTKTTRYVDEAGTPVTIEQIQTGRPVTVHYVKEGDRLIAQRVVVQKPTTETTTSTVGTATTVTPNGIVVQTAPDAAPLRYTYTRTTRYIDDTGAPVTVEHVTSGKPVTVHYVKEGDRFIAQRVVVHRVLPAQPPPVTEKRTKTTTTTEKPVKREKDDDDDDDDDDD